MKTLCRTVVLPMTVTAMVAALMLAVCVMVERLLTEEHNTGFTVTPPHPVDSLGKMRTVGPRLRWPVLLLLTTVLTLSVCVAVLVWSLSRQPSPPSTATLL